MDYLRDRIKEDKLMAISLAAASREEGLEGLGTFVDLLKDSE
jgi:hypothetical protein